MIAILLAFVVPAMIMLLKRSMRVSLIVWVCVVFLFPPWADGAITSIRLAPSFLVSCAVLLAHWRSRRIQFNKADGLVALLGLSLAISLAFHTPAFLVAQGAGEWIACYWAGRLIFSQIDSQAGHYLVIAAFASGALAALQLGTGFNVADWVAGRAGSPASIWQDLQVRNGLPRAELSFGHSIALGGALSLCLPFAVIKPRPRAWPLLAATIVIGILATQSRASIVAAALVCLVAVMFSEAGRTVRVFVVLACLSALIASLPSLLANFVSGGSDATSEVAQGSTYRAQLLDLFQYVNWVGLGSDVSESVDGTTLVWGGARSIDNGLLYVALFAGSITAALYLAAVSCAVIGGLRAGRRAAAVAVLAQIPVLATVAPITQYQSLFWFVIAAAASQVAPPYESQSDRATTKGKSKAST